MKDFENELYLKGLNYVAGVDEVGRGPLVGPVVTAAVILPKDYYDERINDSKKLSEKKRELLYNVIYENALAIGIGMSSNKVIDEINILEATKKAMKEAINNLSIKPEHVLIDAVKLDIDIPSTSIIKGDAKSQSIAAASIIAKVTRDRMMIELDKEHPEYDFKHNKGYGTKKHIEAIYKYGVLDSHRKTFAPISEITKD
jgi:ribonuclease HII